MTQTPSTKPPTSQFPKKRWNDSATISPNSKEVLEKSWLDNYLEKSAYRIIIRLWIPGLIILLVLVALPFLSWDLLEAWKILKKEETARNVYYLFIFVGAGLAAILATWRGRQSERQLREFKRQIQDSRLERQVARFEKAIDMATDHTSADRRAGGFLILSQIFSNWRKDFDHLLEENLDILQIISVTPFWITENKHKDILRKLHKNSRWRYSPEIEGVENLFEITSEYKVNLAALNLWQGITNWRGERWGGFVAPDHTYAICSPVVDKHAHYTYDTYVFFRIELKGVIFLMLDDRGVVDISTPDMQTYLGKHANFRGSYFVEVGMKNAIVDHVDFSDSHFFAINNSLGKRDRKACGMSCIGTIFDGANLINCHFGNTDFENADFDNTNISGSDFSRARNLIPEQFETAYWIRPDASQFLERAKPKFPEGWGDDFADMLPNLPTETEG